MKITKLSDLKLDKKNANKGTSRGRKLLKKSLEELGIGRSILVDRSGNIIAGNKTAETLQSLKQKKIRVIQTSGDELVVVQRTDLDIDSKKARELAVADNRVAELDLDWNAEVLGSLDLELGDYFNDGELRKLLGPQSGDEEVAVKLDQAVELQSKWKTESGQIWEIGRHRIACGSCTDKPTVEKLLQGTKPILMVTDPPYGVCLDSEWRDRSGMNMAPAQPSYMQGDHEQESGDTKADWSDAFELIPSIQVAYVWHASAFTREVLNGLERIGFLYPQQIIWRKPFAIPTRTHYWFQHEPCWYVRKKKAPFFGATGTDASTVWDAIPPKHIMAGSKEKKFAHPTQKPILLYIKAIENHLAEGESCYEPFSGSGTCLAAAEKTSRICYAMEIEPKYVAVALERMADMGLKPKLARRSGKT